jgi:hypothetical protein
VVDGGGQAGDPEGTWNGDSAVPVDTPTPTAARSNNSIPEMLFSGFGSFPCPSRKLHPGSLRCEIRGAACNGNDQKCLLRSVRRHEAGKDRKCSRVNKDGIFGRDSSVAGIGKVTPDNSALTGS